MHIAPLNVCLVSPVFSGRLYKLCGYQENQETSQILVGVELPLCIVFTLS